MSSEKSGNRGSFKPGPDARRHQFTRAERAAGASAAYIVVAVNKPWLIAWLQRKIRKTCTTRARARFKRRQRLYAKGTIDGSGY